jgi:hypothetical protein
MGVDPAGPPAFHRRFVPSSERRSSHLGSSTIREKSGRQLAAPEHDGFIVRGQAVAAAAHGAARARQGLRKAAWLTAHDQVTVLGSVTSRTGHEIRLEG